MTTFNLMHCQPDPRKFVMWAARHKCLPPGGDLGFAFHAALCAVFGSHAPKPFFYRDERAGLIAYTPHSADELREASALCAAPDVVDALGLDAGPHGPGLSVRAFPTQWQTGRVLGFEVRVRPMQRSKRKDRKHGCERDALLTAIERKQTQDDRLEREAVYTQWLREQFTSTGAAEMLEASMKRFQLSDVIRRTQASAPSGKGREPRVIRGPDAVFSGHLMISDPDAFARLLARGVGRHRAFGFGMLLLRPASMNPSR